MTYSQSGTVLDGEGSPLAGITVEIFYDTTVYGQTVTDASGDYTIESSSYPFEGVWVNIAAWDPNETYAGQSVEKYMTSSSQTSSVDFSLDTEGTVTFGVLSTARGPEAGALVGYGDQPPVTTDGGGNFRTPKWNLSTTPYSNYLSAEIADPDVVSWTGGVTVDEASYPAELQQDLYYYRYGSISGTIRDGAGQPLEGIVVSGGGFIRPTTAADGSFTVDEIYPLGSGRFLEFVDPDAQFMWEYYDDVYTRADQTIISVGDDEDVVIEVVLEERPTFNDVASDHPFVWNISWMAITGVSAGYDDGTFRPTAPVTRMAMAAFMYRLAGSPAVTGTCTDFSDVAADHPFCDEIAWMAEAGISTGYPDGTFRPTANVSRMAMSAFMNRLAGSPGPLWYDCTIFSDVNFDHPFCDEIAWMAEAGISEGYNDGTFRPTADVSRMAMSAFMNRFADAGFG